MDFSNIACWIWPLLTGLICAILGYLLGRLFGKKEQITEVVRDDAEIASWRQKNTALKADLDACQSKLLNALNTTSTSDTSTMTSSFAAAGAAIATYDAAAAKAAFGKAIKEDDLTVVEGIGPKIRELFHNFDITTWSALAATSVDKCQEVLKSGGKRFEMHRPEAWPMQAGLAAAGKWAELKKWQDEHDYGKA